MSARTDIRPSRDFDRDLQRIKEFREAFWRFVESRSPKDRVRVAATGQRVEPIIERFGVVVALDPPMVASQHPPRIGITNVALSLDDDVFCPTSESVMRVVLLVDQMLVRVHSDLETRKGLAANRRRNPLYWCDRALRTVLGFPLYLLSAAVGRDLTSVSGSAGVALNIVSTAATVVSIIVTTKALGWW